MKIAVISNQLFKEELCSQGLREEAEVEWHAELANIEDADVIIDLLYIPGKDRMEALKRSGARIILVSWIEGTTTDLPKNFIRINGWPGILRGKAIEYASHSSMHDEEMQTLFGKFSKKALAVPDQPGFISARIIAMIINEAFFALDENVSTKEDIDTAMKLGTNYPFGPFEWAEMIGVKHVHDLLSRLSESNKLYQPAPGLAKQVLS